MEEEKGKKVLHLPIGEFCSSAFYLRDSGIRKEAYPFDWWVIPVQSVLYLLRHGFAALFRETPTRTASGFSVPELGILMPHVTDADDNPDKERSYGQVILKRAARMFERIQNAEEIHLYFADGEQTTNPRDKKLLRMNPSKTEIAIAEKRLLNLKTEFRALFGPTRRIFAHNVVQSWTKDMVRRQRITATLEF